MYYIVYSLSKVMSLLQVIYIETKLLLYKCFKTQKSKLTNHHIM